MILLNEKIHLADLYDVTLRCIDEVVRSDEDLERQKVSFAFVFRPRSKK